MNYIEKTLLLAGTTIVLAGCGSESNSTPEIVIPELPSSEKPAFEVPTVYSLSAFSKGFPVGVAVSESNITNEGITDIVIQHFSQVTAENIMKPEALQPSDNTFNFEKADELVDFAQTNGISIHGHTLVWHNQSPAWMKDCTDTIDCTDTMNNHITTVAQHFAGKVESWDVVNEAFLQDGSYRGSADVDGGIAWVEKIGQNYISKAFTTARAADANAELYYNDYNLAYNDAKIDAVITLVEDMKTAATPIDGIAFQMHVSDTFPTIENISAAFQKAANTGLKVKITELDARMNRDGGATTLTDAIATAQKQRYSEIVEAYLAAVPKNQRGGITVWGVSDADSWYSINDNNHIDWPLMFDGKLNQKPALLGFADAMLNEPEAPKEPLGPFQGYADDFSDEEHFAEKDGERYLAYNPVEQAIDFQINWSAFDGSSEYNVTRTFDTPLDITRGVNLIIKVKLPQANLDDGNVIIQPFLESDSGPAFIGYVQGSAFTSTLDAEGWSTITLENIGPDFAFGYIDGFDFDAVKALGLQFKSSGDTAPATGVIQITEVSIIDPNADKNVTPAAPGEEILTNPGFEAGTDSWFGHGPTVVELEETEAHSGYNSAKASGRTNTWNGIAHDLNGMLTADATYNISAWVKLANVASASVGLSVKVTDDSGDHYVGVTTITATDGDWMQLTGTYTHVVDGTEVTTYVYLEGPEAGVDYYIDDISVKLAE